MTERTILTPTVHMNGTNKSDLFEQNMAAVRAIRDAETKLAAACPNGRDYYTQGPDAIQRVLAEHTARLNRLSHVRNELETILESIQK